MSDWTRGEMLAVAASREVHDDDVVVVGLGLPQIAALLAQRIHAPNVRLLLEIGVFEPTPSETAMGIADPRMWAGATAFGGMLDVLGTMLHGGRVTLGLLGALEVDADGSVNSTKVTGEDGRVRRFNGSGGANDIASSAGRVVVVMQHHRRKFAEAVHFLTSPGVRVRGVSRPELGLPGRGTVAVVTDRAVIEISEDGAVLASVHPGEDEAEVRAATGLPFVDAGAARATSPPTLEQLDLIRRELDPLGWYTR